MVLLRAGGVRGTYFKRRVTDLLQITRVPFHRDPSKTGMQKLRTPAVAWDTTSKYGSDPPNTQLTQFLPPLPFQQSSLSLSLILKTCNVCRVVILKMWSEFM